MGWSSNFLSLNPSKTELEKPDYPLIHLPNAVVHSFIQHLRSRTVPLTCVSDLFLKVASRSIIDFIKETGLFRKMLVHDFCRILIIYTRDVSISTLFLYVERVSLKSFLTCLICFYIFAFLCTNRLNSADVPLQSIQT